MMKIQSNNRRGVTTCLLFVARCSLLSTIFANVVGSAAFAEERTNPFEEDFIIPKTGVQKCETVDILKKAYPKWNATKVWHPKKAKGEIVANPSQVVSYCDKWSRHAMGDFGGSKCAWRGAGGPINEAEGGWKAITKSTDYDVDGNGEVDQGEIVHSFQWDMKTPMGISMWPFSGTFPERTSYKLYGGASGYVTHGIVKKGNGQQVGGFAEMGINYDHNNTWWDQRAGDHPLNIMPYAKNSKSWLQAYYVLCWKKEDFLNLNDMKYKVTFDDNSRLSSTICRVYWVGWHDVRMIVQDGDQWYISDNKQFVFPEGNGFGRRTDGSTRKGVSFQMKPNLATWTEYNPDGYKLHLDHETAKYAKREFEDIQAMGWWIGKDRKTKGEQAHVKWYGFAGEAVINRPAQGSPNIDMNEIKGKSGNFYMTTCEIPYAFAKKIHKWGDVPFHSLDARYVYRTHPDMGSMSYGKNSHSQDEPATNIEWYDALAFCNTMSEFEGKEPVYYLDPSFEKIFRGDHITTKSKMKKAGGVKYDPTKENPTWDKVVAPKIFVKWAANGHRLPTVSEWEVAAGASATAHPKTDGTIAVGSGVANANGLYDMNGNVWELVWTHGNVYDPANSEITALGGGFQQVANPAKNALSKYGDTPWNGNANIGLRIVRRKPGLPAPAKANARTPSSSEIPAWSFKRYERTIAKAKAITTDKKMLDMTKIPAGTFVRTHDKKNIQINSFYASKHETSYTKWQRVLEWAEANGYEFSKNGDMGSMYYLGHSHKGTEPVVEITWFDMIVWCNALSEMEGKTPLFYTDPAKSIVMRKAPVYRPIKISTKEMFDPDKEPWGYKYMGAGINHPTPWVFIKWNEDGYRLPTPAEMEYMMKAGNKEIELSNASSWNISNSGGKTHPIGTKKANDFGLYDTVGNAFEWTIGIEGRELSKRKHPNSLDVNNPKQALSLTYGNKKTRGHSCKIHFGGSWLQGIDSLIYIYTGNMGRNPYDYFPDFGFRAVSCDKGTHPEDGKEKLLTPNQLKINPEHFNSGEE